MTDKTDRGGWTVEAAVGRFLTSRYLRRVEATEEETAHFERIVTECAEAVLREYTEMTRHGTADKDTPSSRAHENGGNSNQYQPRKK